MHNLRRRGKPRLFCFYTLSSSTQHNGEYFQKIYNHIILGHVSCTFNLEVQEKSQLMDTGGEPPVSIS